MIAEYSFQAMGTACRVVIDVPDRTEVDDVAQQAIDEVYRLEETYSRYRDDSFLSEINRSCGMGKTVIIDPETSFLLDYAAEAWRLSEGAFDVTSGILRRVWRPDADVASIDASLAVLRPHIGFDKVVREGDRLSFAVTDVELDFGGLVKEYAADRAVAVCRSQGIQAGLIDLGGDIAVIGPQLGERPWPIAIASVPGQTNSLPPVLLSHGGIATSGDYARGLRIGDKTYSHILDARTGLPTTGLASVTVIAPTAMAAGTLATLAMLRGADGAVWLKARGCRFLAIDSGGSLQTSSDWSA